ncbi:MAG: alpha/beta fold hydrolase [Candidatus Brocadiia bacterium]
MRKRKLRKLVGCVFLLMCLLAAALLGCNLAACRLMRSRGTSHPVDPESGIMQGGGPVRITSERERACLLLHGWLTTPADFGPLPQALDEAGWDVFAPLQKGHGTKPNDLQGVTADDLLGAARKHYQRVRSEYDHVALVGFSMGGTMATLLAAEEPPDQLVLVAPFFGVRHRWYYVLPARWWGGILRPVLRCVWRGRGGVHVNRPEGRDEVRMYCGFPTSVVTALFELRRRVPAADVSVLNCPVLLVYSEGDGVCSPEATERFAAGLPGGSVLRKVFTRSDHHLMLDYDRQAAAEAIVEFLAEAQPRD